MRFLLKILAFPFFIILAPVVAVSLFITSLGETLLRVVSVILVLTGLITFWGVDSISMSDYYFRSAVAQLVGAFLVSPYGIPKLLSCFVEWLAGIKNSLRLFLAS